MTLARLSFLCYPLIPLLLEQVTGASLTSMSGMHLRVIVGNFNPSTLVLRNSSGDVIGYSGVVYNHLEWVSRFLNFTFTPQPAKENSNGVRLPDGTWSGIIGQIMRDEGDLACTPIAAVLQRSEAIEFASYVGGDGTGILVKQPIPYLSFFGLTMAFSLNVWIGWLVSFVAVVTGFYAIAYVKRSMLDIRSGDAIVLSDMAIKAVAVVTSQGSLRRSGNLPGTLLAVAWIAAAFVFVNTYSSCLTSYMSLTFKRPDINSFQDLADHQKLKAVVRKGSVSEIDILKADHGPLKTIGDRILKCDDECRLTDISNVINMVLGGEYVAIQANTVVRSMMLHAMLINKGQCPLTMAKETMAYLHMYLGLPKGSPYVTEMNRGSFWWFALGIHAYVKRRETYRSERCILRYDYSGVSVEMPERVSLKLEQFYFAFVILFAGYVMAFVQFIQEKVVDQQSQTQNSV